MKRDFRQRYSELIEQRFSASAVCLELYHQQATSKSYIPIIDLLNNHGNKFVDRCHLRHRPHSLRRGKPAGHKESIPPLRLSHAGHVPHRIRHQRHNLHPLQLQDHKDPSPVSKFARVAGPIRRQHNWWCHAGSGDKLNGCLSRDGPRAGHGGYWRQSAARMHVAPCGRYLGAV